MRQIFVKDWFVDAHMQERDLLETQTVPVMSGLASLPARDHRFAFPQGSMRREMRGVPMIFPILVRWRAINLPPLNSF